MKDDLMHLLPQEKSLGEQVSLPETKYKRLIRQRNTENGFNLEC